MKPTLKFITAPLAFWSNEQLSVNAKWVAISIDAYCDSPQGVAMGVKAIQTATGLTAKEVKDALLELREKGALEVNMGEDSQKLLKPLLYKDSYAPVGEKVVIGDKPTDANPLPWDEISEKWQEICFMLPKITRWSPQRKNKVKSTLKQSGCTVENLYQAFKLVASSSFLNGSKSDQWSCTFDWLIKSSSNLIKVLEGNYHNRDYNEKRQYEDIMQGRDVTKKDDADDYYR